MKNQYKENCLRVGYFARRRLVVYNMEAQHDSPELMLLYSVHGHKLCVRSRAEDERKLSFNVRRETVEFALEQYERWLRDNAEQIVSKRHSTVIDSLPLMRKTCPTCEGQGNWMDRVNKCSYGVIEEEANIVEQCPTCRGLCYVDDML